ncbi:hypothetical protein BDQ17DRAFT_1351427 [Cyathus striatus]|nr:hypothetical protein BDQ17DRAFT_1351427 [Cyathus striatus]
MIPRTFSLPSELTGPPQPDPTLSPQSTEATGTSTRSAFQSGSSVSRISGEEPQGSTGNIAKSILEYVFLAIAIIIRTNQPLNKFFTIDRDQSNSYAVPRNLPRTTGLPPIPRSGGGYPLYNNFLAGVPATVRAFDIEAGGRRLGTNAENDHDVLNDKDALPAYDKAGSPPNSPISTSEDNRNLGVTPVIACIRTTEGSGNQTLFQEELPRSNELVDSIHKAQIFSSDV